MPTKRNRPKKEPDDLRRSRLAMGATFDGILEIPFIAPPVINNPPEVAIPFSKRSRSRNHTELLVFDEYEEKFQELVENPDAFLEELREYPAVFSPDLSLYRNATLAAQITNVYDSRLTGSYLQRNGVNIVPFIRWGDERSFTTVELPEPFALLGAYEGSVIGVGPYGCVKTHADQEIFRAGLIAAIERIHPRMVFSYGPKPDRIFGGLESMTKFVFYEDWTSRVRSHRG